MLFLTSERTRRGWSRAELARRAGLNATTISLIESRRFRPYPGQLRKLAAALAVPEDQAEALLGDSEQVGRGQP
jgi:transcriptional regulator with XRE-family HTH domain